MKDNKAKIETLKKILKDKGLKPNPPLAEKEITDFETKHGIKLPEEYRDFLLEIGNGVADDNHFTYLQNEIAPLGEVAKDMYPHQKEQYINLPNVKKPFPFTQAWIWENEKEGDSPEEKYDSTDFGHIYLANDGDGEYWHLIITGPERGIMWIFTGEGITPSQPKRDFLSWYIDRLNGIM